MNSNLSSLWSGFSASIIGSGHIKRGLPCQDASAVVTGPRPALIVCDGRGSASRSQDGANGAVRDFTSQCAVFEPMLAAILDADEADAGRWEQFCRILYRTLMQTKLNLSAEQNVPEKEFDFTVAVAIVGTNWIGCFQVGDGAIVLRQNGTMETAFSPDKGEFANQTHFLRENGEAKGKFHAKLFSAKENSGIAITSDGPEHLMFHLATMTPGKIFSMFFDDMQSRSLTKQDIMDYLTRREWDKDPRGQDDRSIAILAPELRQQEVEAASDPLDTAEMPVAPQNEAETTGDAVEGGQADEPLTKTRNEAEEVETSRNTDSPAAENVNHEVDDKNEKERDLAPEHASAANRINLISGGITGAAILALLLSMVHFQSEMKVMHKELGAIQAQQTTIVEKMQQPHDKTAVESPCQPADTNTIVAESLHQPPEATDVPPLDVTIVDEEYAHADTFGEDNVAVGMADSSAGQTFFSQKTEECFGEDGEEVCMTPSEIGLSESHPEE